MVHFYPWFKANTTIYHLQIVDCSNAIFNR